LGIRIVDLNDPRVALYRGIRDPELVRTHRVFIAEGRLVVRRLLESPHFRARSVLVTPAARAGLADLLEWSDGIEIYEAELPLFRDLTGFNVHRGCLAIGVRRGPAPSWQEVVRPARTVVVLERVGNPDNVGGVFRAAAALGADAVLLSPGCADPLYRKSIRTSMAAALTLPFAVIERWPAGLTELRSLGFSIVALTPSGNEEISAVQRPERAALLLGHEGVGLTAETLALSDRRVRIPMMPAADSLNVVTAAAVALDRLRP
jgi:tRNA G18 (ribose-2'-O)-methylase SpoU